MGRVDAGRGVDTLVEAGRRAPVAEGEPLAEFETDKVEVELESPASGILTRVFAAEEDTIDVGAVIAEIEEA